jgi:O-antigen ligase
MQLTAPTTSGTIAGFLQDGDFSPFLRRETYVSKPAGRAGFVLLLLATAALLVRPSDLLPELEHWPVYQWIIVLCLAFSIRPVIHQLRTQVRARAITLLLIGFGITVVTSHLLRGNLYAARIGGFEFFKIIAYYLVVLATVDSIKRLRLFMLGLCASTLLLTTLSVLAYDGLLDVPSLAAIRQADATSEDGVVERLVGTGIFNDPNDLSLILVVAIGCCFCFAATATSRFARVGWWLPIGFFLYAIALTHSRGGLLALIGGTVIAMGARMGAARALLLTSALVPLVLIFSSGRQTQVDLNDPTDTFQTRLDRWSDALTLFKQSPLIGVGQDQQVEYCGQVAHNTYIQNFAELGIVGGACFLGMMMFCLRGVLKVDLQRCDPILTTFRPYLAGGLAGYAIGLISLSRGYTISTYLVFALAAAYINLAPRRSILGINGIFIRQLAIASLLTIAATYLTIRLLSGWGGAA